MSRPRLVPVLSVLIRTPVHWRTAGTGEYARTEMTTNYGRTVDYATRDGKTIERFGRAGLVIRRDCYGMLTDGFRDQ